jgi:hypothetical protein
MEKIWKEAAVCGSKVPLQQLPGGTTKTISEWRTLRRELEFHTHVKGKKKHGCHVLN